MQPKTKRPINETLNPSRFARAINQTPELRAGLPRQSLDELTDEEIRAAKIAAIGRGASALAMSREKEFGAYDLDANLFELIANITDFAEAQRSMDAFKDTYGTTKFKLIDPTQVSEYTANKQTVIKFNHILHEVINAGAHAFDFSELVAFMTQQYGAISGEKNLANFEGIARMAVNGMRNELAVEQILIQNGIDFELGDENDEVHGGDFIVNGVRIDIKSTLARTEKAQQRERELGRNPDHVIWSHIDFKDYQGKLSLSQEGIEKASKELIPLINRAAGTAYQAVAS